jgi:hypothetical protein
MKGIVEKIDNKMLERYGCTQITGKYNVQNLGLQLEEGNKQ